MILPSIRKRPALTHTVLRLLRQPGVAVLMSETLSRTLTQGRGQVMYDCWASANAQEQNARHPPPPHMPFAAWESLSLSFKRKRKRTCARPTPFAY